MKIYDPVSEETLAKLRDDHGVVLVHDDYPGLVLRLPNDVEAARLTGCMLADGVKGEKRTSELRNIARACVVHPEIGEYDAAVKVYAMLPLALAEILMEGAKGASVEKAKKYMRASR